MDKLFIIRLFQERLLRGKGNPRRKITKSNQQAVVEEENSNIQEAHENTTKFSSKQIYVH